MKLLVTLLFALFFASFALCQVETITVIQQNVAAASFVSTNTNVQLFAYKQMNQNAQIQVVVAVTSSVGGAQIQAQIQACSLPNQPFLIYQPNPVATCTASLTGNCTLAPAVQTCSNQASSTWFIAVTLNSGTSANFTLTASETVLTIIQETGSFSDQVQVGGTNYYGISVASGTNVLDLTLVPVQNGITWPILRMYLGTNPFASDGCAISSCTVNSQLACIVSLSSSCSSNALTGGTYYISVVNQGNVASNYSILVTEQTSVSYTPLTNGLLNVNGTLNTITYYSLSVPGSTSTYTVSLTLTLNTVANNIQASVLFSQGAYPTSARGCNIQRCSVDGGSPTCNLSIDSCQYSTTTMFYIAVQLYGTGTAAYVPYTITINVVEPSITPTTLPLGTPISAQVPPNGAGGFSYFEVSTNQMSDSSFLQIQFTNVTLGTGGSAYGQSFRASISSVVLSSAGSSCSEAAQSITIASAAPNNYYFTVPGCDLTNLNGPFYITLQHTGGGGVPSLLNFTMTATVVKPTSVTPGVYNVTVAAGQSSAFQISTGSSSYLSISSTSNSQSGNVPLSIATSLCSTPLATCGFNQNPCTLSTSLEGCSATTIYGIVTGAGGSATTVSSNISLPNPTPLPSAPFIANYTSATSYSWSISQSTSIRIQANSSSLNTYTLTFTNCAANTYTKLCSAYSQCEIYISSPTAVTTGNWVLTVTPSVNPQVIALNIIYGVANCRTNITYLLSFCNGTISDTQAVSLLSDAEIVAADQNAELAYAALNVLSNSCSASKSYVCNFYLTGCDSNGFSLNQCQEACQSFLSSCSTTSSCLSNLCSSLNPCTSTTSSGTSSSGHASSSTRVSASFGFVAFLFFAILALWI